MLRAKVEEDLNKRYSPEQIAGRLRVEFPDEPEMRVSPETIYQSLYVQSRGALKRDLTVCLRTGRAIRQPCRKAGQRKNRIPGMINISERPAEVQDRAVPGHWEGDLIIGKGNQSAIGTLVERSTNYTMLVYLPDGYKAEQMRYALAAKIKTLPEALRHSLTWDQGIEIQDWKNVKIDAGIDIYFCDPHSPWQRGINENQWPAAPVLPQRHGPEHPQRRRPRLGRTGTQRPATQKARVQKTDRIDRRTPVAITA